MEVGTLAEDQAVAKAVAVAKAGTTAAGTTEAETTVGVDRMAGKTTSNSVRSKTST